MRQPGFQLPRSNGNGGQGAVQVATPFTDYQVVALMGAILMAGQPLPANEAEREAQADAATGRALDLLAHGAYKQGLGVITRTVMNGKSLGQQHAKEMLEAEEAAQREAGGKVLGPDGQQVGTGE